MEKNTMKHILLILTALLLAPLATLHAVEPPKSEPLPDVSQWRLPRYDESFFQGRAVCREGGSGSEHGHVRVTGVETAP